MTAVRLARGATGRPKILKFAGCYHGHLDALLVQAGSGVATLGLPGSAGVTEGTVADTIVVPYNDLAALDAVLAEHGDAARGDPGRTDRRQHGARSAAPTASSTGCASAARATGALLVFDEVITGFRVGLAGRARPVQDHARPLDLRQGRRRRSPARGGRRRGCRHGRARAARSRVPGGHAVGEPARDRGRARRARAPRRRQLRPARSNGRAPRGRPARRVRQGRRRRAGHARVHARRPVLRAGSGARLRRRASGRPRAATRSSSTDCSIEACTSRRAATRRSSRAWRTPMPTSSKRSRPQQMPRPRCAERVER